MRPLSEMPDLRSGEDLYNRKKIWELLLPLMAERLLLSLMGTADTLMVANAGEAAVSAVSLVNSINAVMIQLFSALAVGGSVVITQLVGAGDLHEARQSARQLLMSVTAVSALVALLCVLLRGFILGKLYPNVEGSVMEGASLYLLITALSYPFLALETAAAAVFRSGGNTRLPMRVSICANLINIGGNALLIFGFRLGVLGAALPTLFGRMFSALVLCVLLRNRDFKLYTRSWLWMKPSRKRIVRMMRIGVPTGVENSLFELGKLAVQSIVSSAGTAALAANAIAISMESFSSKIPEAINTTLLVVAGTCIGAGRIGEARKNVKRLAIYCQIGTMSVCLLTMLLVRPVCALSGLSAESTALAVRMCLILHCIKMVIYIPSFTLTSAMRSAGDVKYTMVLAVCSMWCCRVALCYVLFRYAGQGPMAMWWGMSADWLVRGTANIIRYQSGAWTKKTVVGRKE